ncbi:MAG: response regulator transcription factor [Candidatus Eisenbacteria bacterium]|nr:response regulator transcription factor [Candidatus Eisenbacteria bacterium]
MSTTPTILLVEDDARIAGVTRKNLEAAGFRCLHAADGPGALREVERASPDLIVLDVMLPGLDGLEVTRRIRKTSRVPILMLTARDTEADKVLGLEVGADDYLTKPFSIREMIARIRALLRRTTPDSNAAILVRGGLTIDPGERIVTIGGQRPDLTALEFDLLEYLARHPRRVFTREALMNQVWGEDRVVDARSIDSLISRLRKKLGAIPGGSNCINTVWGAGYRFLEPGNGAP